MRSTADDGRLGWRLGVALTTVALAAGSIAGYASPPGKSATHASSATSASGAADLKLLEFLGTVDTESARTDDGGWMAYLSQLKLGKNVAKASQTPPAQKPAPAKPMPRTSGVSNDD